VACQIRPPDDPLHAVVASLVAGRERIAVVGPVGAGKTELLHRIAERLGRGFTCAYLPIPTLDPPAIRDWIAEFVGPLPADAGSALADLAFAHARRGVALVLLLDDAHAMPLEVARALDAEIARAQDALRVVLAALDEPRLADVLGSLGGPVERVELPAQPPVESAPARPAFPLDAVTAAAVHERVAQMRAAEGGLPPPALRRMDAGERPHRAVTTRRRPLDRLWPGALVAMALVSLTGAFWLGRATAPQGAPPPLPVASVALPEAPAPTPPATAPAAAPDPAVLVHVNARPWARIEVDGREIGVTPLGRVPLPAGSHTFRAHMADGRVLEREVAIDSERRRVSFP
jgi:hypothetical protein